MNNILITGITGFVGSQLAETLVENNFKVIGLKRSRSNIWRCEEFKDKITWVDIDGKVDYKNALEVLGFDILVHCAWIGVETDERLIWDLQLKNLTFLSELLQISKKVNVKKIIVLGSQAEYGEFEGKISETYPTNPLNAYAAIKLACLELTKNFANINDIKWIWIRVFSLFGEKEGINWLIPNTLNSITNNIKLELTPGEQKYSYLYIKDFAEVVYKIIYKNVDSGVYNVSSVISFSIKSIVTQIRNKVNPSFELKFGTLEYRENQSMHIEGDMKKLEDQIGKIHFTDFNLAIENTINYFLNKKLS
jgi:nucleoside-diphosphate-sugar epimerase